VELDPPPPKTDGKAAFAQPLSRRRPLSPPVLQHLLQRETHWKGNVRALQTLLSLLASTANLPVHNHHSLGQLIDVIMPPDSDFYDWVGIVLQSLPDDSLSQRDATVQAILKLDQGHKCHGLGIHEPEPLPTGSELDAQARLSSAGDKVFKQLLSEQLLKKVKTTTSAKDEEKRKREKSTLVRRSVRLARMLAYAARRQRIDRHVCVELCGIQAGQAAEDLKLLEKAGLLAAQNNNVSDGQANTLELTVYLPVAGMFQAATAAAPHSD
jgi:hypothetical protein